MSNPLRLLSSALVVALALTPALSISAASLDPASVEFKTAQQIQWVRNAEGTSERAILFGDPSKPGPYVMRIKWLPGNFSRPHFHNGDRFFTVISGTWWVGTGDHYDPNNTVPVPAGSYVLHKGGQLHYDGAKDEETIIQVTGYGPLETTQAKAH
jgi:quercetin dioxygenase-like cupin family protein